MEAYRQQQARRNQEAASQPFRPPSFVAPSAAGNTMTSSQHASARPDVVDLTADSPVAASKKPDGALGLSGPASGPAGAPAAMSQGGPVGPNGEKYLYIPRRDKHAPATSIKILDDDPPAPLDRRPLTSSIAPQAQQPTKPSGQQSAAAPSGPNPTASQNAFPQRHPHLQSMANVVKPAFASAQKFLNDFSKELKQNHPMYPSVVHVPGQPPPPLLQHNGTSTSSRPPARYHPAAHQASSTDPYAAYYDDDRPPPSFGGPMIKPEDRDKQLQEMISNVVDVADVDTSDLHMQEIQKGLRCDLMPHQVQGVAWMVQREKGKDKGGILADDMGLGKTVQMLALIIGNRPDAEHSTIRYVEEPPKASTTKKSAGERVVSGPKRSELELKSKTTLVVAPLAVIRQWEQEIKSKSVAPLKVCVHHGTGRLKSADALSKFDVVITTYTTAAAEWGNTPEGLAAAEAKNKRSKSKGKAVAQEEAESEEDSEEDGSAASDGDSDSSVEVVKGPGRQAVALNGRKSPSKSKPAAKKQPKTPPTPLFDMHWLRVVLDEAQNIKNHRAKCSLASYALGRKAHAKWCLSGTPIQNTSYELYSLIHFLSIPPFNEYKHFREKIGEPLQSTNQNRVNWGLKRLRVVLGAIMLRRTKDAEHEGKKILQLPPREVQVVETDFQDPAEREFYAALESKMQTTLKEAEEKEGKINRMGALVMLLRLRQACSHPALTMKNISVDAAASAPVPSNSESSSARSAPAPAETDDADDLVNALAGLTVAQTCDMCRAPLDAGVLGGRCAECKANVARSTAAGNDWLKPGRTSTKVALMLRKLKEFNKDAPQEKTIVFSQFTTFLDLVEPYLKQEGLNYVRYDGSMKPEAREDALQTIKTRDECKIILISFKAGSTGLNLTCCSRVLLMDLWWNPQIEEQAFDRAHRLGQKRAVHVYKLSVKNTVEERLLLIQKKKRELANSALTGEKLQKGKKNQLSMAELLYLFNGEG